ncbi:RING finger protein 103 [Zootermopsis nevadensis]|uniref:RING finger protein 103 n=1 Tax=Zootermopsis nevadensis TaxID=136037 RepID=A0A067QIT6_ZOONE|nr:RING finger protein 103 [Zootermopsis nevadensis]
MRSIWIQATLLIIYLVLVFLISRILDLVLWYQHGISSTQIVDPLLLSVRQLKHLLENRGVSYAGYVEKKELAELVEASDKSARERLTAPSPPSHFTGGPHFYEEVEDTKDSVWLVQVVPTGGPHVEPLLDDYSWHIVCSQVAPFAIRTGVFDCRLDRRLCSSKGWHHPLLLLALPKGTRAKDRVILKTFTSTRPQSIVEWVRDQLSIRVKNIHDIDELNRDWLQDESAGNNATSASSSGSSSDVKVLLLTHLLHPPLFLAALSIKFTGRIKFGMFSLKKEDSEAVRKKLKLLDHQIPSYLIVTPERKVVYGQRRFEHFNFASMNLFLRAVQPEMNDVFLCSLVLVNMLVSLQIFQVSFRFWWKCVARCLWTAVSYNFWLFSVWLLILATYRFSLVSFLADKGLILVRYMSLTEIGSMLRADWQILTQHPYMLFFTFFVYGFMATWLLWQHCHDETEIERESNHPWWEVLPVDSYWINCLFRPMVTLTRPLLPSELELDESIEMLIDRLAVPNFWLQPVIPNDYVKDLPVWKFRGWDNSALKINGKHINKTDNSPEVVERMMDGEDPYEMPCQNCAVHCCGCASERVKYRHLESSHSRNMKGSLSYSEESGDETSNLPAGMLPTTECAVCLESYRWGTILCGLPCGHNYHQCCIMEWLGRDNHHCPVCRWPAYKSKHGLSHLHGE